MILALNIHGFHVHPMALGDQEGTAEFKVLADSDSSSLLPPTTGWDKMGLRSDLTVLETQQVRVRTLDALTKEAKINQIDILKVDAQGYDLRILQGGQRLLQEKRVGVIIVEVLFRKLYEGQPVFYDIAEYLRSQQYGLAGLYEWHRDVDQCIYYSDAVFVQQNTAEGL